MTYKSLQLRTETFHRLQDKKQSAGESFEAVLLRLLNKYEGLL